MAWRPRKSIRLGKGFRINLSRSGIGWSAGVPKFFRFGIGADSRRRSSIGSGLFRQEWNLGKAVAIEKGTSGGCCSCSGPVVLGFFVVAILVGVTGVLQEQSTNGFNSGSAGERSEHHVVEKTPAEGVVHLESKSIRVPTEVRSWKSADGRVLVGRVTEINSSADTVTLERSDGQTFKDFPISRLHPEDASLLRSEITR